MTIRERLAQLESEGESSQPYPLNPLRDLILRLCEAVTLDFQNRLSEHLSVQDGDSDVIPDETEKLLDECRAVALRDLGDALDTYGIVAAYPELLAAAKSFIRFAEGDGSDVAVPIGLIILDRFRKAVAFSEQSLVVDSDVTTAKPTPEDVPL